MKQLAGIMGMWVLTSFSELGGVSVSVSEERFGHWASRLRSFLDKLPECPPPNPN